jgi:hypothetical protein
MAAAPLTLGQLQHLRPMGAALGRQIITFHRGMLREATRSVAAPQAVGPADPIHVEQQAKTLFKRQIGSWDCAMALPARFGSQTVAVGRVCPVRVGLASAVFSRSIALTTETGLGSQRRLRGFTPFGPIQFVLQGVAEAFVGVDAGQQCLAASCCQAALAARTVCPGPACPLGAESLLGMTAGV